MVKSVFFSFSGDDQVWVQQFKDKRYFARHLPGIRVFDYAVDGQALPFGPLDEWLKDKVNECVAVFAFLSKSYTESRACSVELKIALDRFVKKKVLFVPVVMDIEGEEFWRKLKADEEYKEHLVGYQYCTFVGNHGGPRSIIVNGEPEFEVTQKISSLAKVVQSWITLLEQARAPASRPLSFPSKHRLVLLGDPLRSTLDEEVAGDFSRLENQLSEAKIPYKTWHAWRKGEPPSEDRLQLPATFLRVVSRYESEDEAKAPNTLQWLNECGRVEGEVKDGVILWQPHISDDSVERQLDWGILRKDTAQALAQWLVDRFGNSKDAPDLLIIDEPRYAVVAFSEVVKMVFNLTNTKMRGKGMNSEQFKHFIKQIDNRYQKLVVAILDSNVNMSEEGDYGPLERFEERVEDWQNEFKRIRGEKGLSAQVVWVAVMTKLAHLAPYAIWNKETDEEICVLKVKRLKGQTGAAEFEPDPDSAVMVASAVQKLIGRSS